MYPAKKEVIALRALHDAPGLRREDTTPYSVTASAPTKAEEKSSVEVLSRLALTATRLRLKASEGDF